MMPEDFIPYAIAAAYVASMIGTWLLLAKKWLHMFGEVSLSDALLFTVLSIAGPLSFAAMVASYTINCLLRRDSPIIMRSKNHHDR